MHYHWRLHRWQLDISLTRRQRVSGVNSRLQDGAHFLMWDFDNIGIEVVSLELARIQEEFGLPKIYLLQSSYARHYHAYCFSRHTWAEVLYILLSTRHVDKQFIKLGTFREYMTLRFSDKPHTEITAVLTLDSVNPETVSPTEATSFESYFAKVRT